MKIVKNTLIFSTFKEYERWLCANLEKALEYLKANDVLIKDMQLSTRAYNALRFNKKIYFSEIVLESDESIIAYEMMDKSSAQEIIMLKKNYLRKHKDHIINYIINGSSISKCEINTAKADNETEGVNDITRSINDCESFEDKTFIIEGSNDDNNKSDTVGNASLDIIAIKEFLQNPEKEDYTKSELHFLTLKIEELDLSVRLYNAIKRAGINYIYEAIELYPDQFSHLRNMGQKSVEELCAKLEKFVSDRQSSAILINEDEPMVHEAVPTTILQLTNHPIFAEKANEFIKIQDFSIDSLGLSVRSTNGLKREGIINFSDILKDFPNNLYSIRNLGAKSIEEIKTAVLSKLEKLDESAYAFCIGDMDALYSDDYITQKIDKCFENVEFNGISFSQIRDAFPEDFNETRIKKCIGRLLADKKLEYVDFRLYKVYPSIFDALEMCDLKDNAQEIIKRRFDGETLEEIASHYGVTRERVRQIFSKNLKKLRIFASTELEIDVFDEDYYAYLFSNYEVDREMWNDYLGVSSNTFNYLIYTCDKGKNEIKDALSDPNVDLALKFKIQDYLNRNKIIINGVFIEKQRVAIEEYAFSLLCQDEMTFDEFAEQYNDLLMANGIEFDAKIYYTEEVLRTRANNLSSSKYCLWKQGERLRYYDIEGHDYNELFDTLQLNTFNNIEISTLKFINDYPELMKKYDIRDQYELHNLLKKIVDVNKYPNVVFHRQPCIQFGEFDRTRAIEEIIAAFSPISAEDLADYTYTEYGYDKVTAIATYFQPLKHLYHQGYYSLDFKPIPMERVERLKELLTEEFYYFDDIKAIYSKEFEDADVEEINHRSLKSIGYYVFSNYILKTFATAESYFSDLLLKDDVFSIATLNKRHIGNRTYFATLYTLRRNYDILVFDDGQYINLRRLEKMGISKNDIIEYCDTVYNLIEDDEYFTIHSIKELNITSKLDELGFDDVFFANILAINSRFQSTQVFGNYVLYKGQAEKGISKKSFILSLISKYTDVDIDQFKDDCFEIYGVQIPEKHEIINAISGTEFYYDEIMDKIYRNKSYYYSEFED